VKSSPTILRLELSQICRRGETPFLHAFADNTAAIRLYESLGFVFRTGMHVQVIGRE